jgi:hypothetical protein
MGENGKRLLSRAAVGEMTETLWAEYDAFGTRDLGEHRIVENESPEADRRGRVQPRSAATPSSVPSNRSSCSGLE